MVAPRFSRRGALSPMPSTFKILRMSLFFSLVFSVVFVASVFFTFDTVAEMRKDVVRILAPAKTVKIQGKPEGLAITSAIGATFDDDGELLISPGSKLPLQNNIFTPQHVLDGRLYDYVSLPVFDENVTYENIQERVKKSIARQVGEPCGLMHQGTPPGHDAVMGLATYHQDDVEVFRLLVGSLRTAGFDGHIILGVTPFISDKVKSYLIKMDVTFYGVDKVPCDESITDGGEGGVRNTCAKGVEYLTVEKGRFEMSRQWLHACKLCTGWVLVMDTRDIFFQRPPFAGMPPPDKSMYDLLFIEEIAPYSQPKQGNPRTDVTSLHNGWYQGSDYGCYGHNYHVRYPDRAILCSGTIIGNRKGIDRFLAVFVDEFLENMKKPNLICKSSETPDQLILQPMYYSGYFGDIERTRTSPWGAGPVNTIGVPCVRSGVHSSLDLTEFDKDSGLILNPNVKDDHPMRVAPIIHQYDRCHDWIHPFFRKHDMELFGGPLEQQKNLTWTVEGLKNLE